MDKKTYYKEVHERLGKKYNLLPRSVAKIRSLKMNSPKLKIYFEDKLSKKMKSLKELMSNIIEVKQILTFLEK